MDNDGKRQEPPAEEAFDEKEQRLRTQPFDAAPDVPGQQVNDPDEQAAAGVHRHRIRPQRRGGGPR